MGEFDVLVSTPFDQMLWPIALLATALVIFWATLFYFAVKRRSQAVPQHCPAWDGSAAEQVELRIKARTRGERGRRLDTARRRGTR